MIEPLCSFVKKNDMPQKRIKALISDSSLNAYGSRILTSGIDIEQYKRNPILLWMHRRADGGRKDEVLPLGHVEDLVIEGDALYGVPVFDAVDDFAKNVQALWESGTIKMVSGHFDIIELSADSQYMLPGQTRETVTKAGFGRSASSTLEPMTMPCRCPATASCCAPRTGPTTCLCSRTPNQLLMNICQN